MAVSKSDTSLTADKIHDFIHGTKPQKAELACEKVTGFHFCKIGAAGSFRYRYTDESGKRRVATIGNYPAMKANEAAQRAIAWRNNGTNPLAEKSHKRVTARAEREGSAGRNLGDYFRGAYADHQARKSEGGKPTLYIIKHNFSGLFDKDMATIQSADIEKWQRKREREGIAHVTIARAFGALNTMLNHAAHKKVIALNPLAGFKLNPPTAKEKEQAKADDEADAQSSRRMLTDAEMAGLLKGLDRYADELRARRRNSRAHGKPHLPDLDKVAIAHWFIPFYHLALETGMRPGDCYSVTWTQLSLAFKRLVKTPEKTMHHPDPIEIRLDLSARLIALMKIWHKQQGSPKSGYVFPTTSNKSTIKATTNGRRLGRQAHKASWKRVLALGGIHAALHFYSLRHHFISSLIGLGVPLKTIAAMAGHKSTVMIEKHYAHLLQSTSKDVMAQYHATLATLNRTPAVEAAALPAPAEATRKTA